MSSFTGASSIDLSSDAFSFSEDFGPRNLHGTATEEHKGKSSFLHIGFTEALQFNSRKSVQKLFYNLHIIFSNSFKFICQLEKEPLQGLANIQETVS